ncbi:class I SAM-dependent methyltransferase [Nocardioides sp. Bht2]|uniref:class I SAM-dependent methyltransferase n=1 Tax=Nocardioides sp. Bht2 TaxID=3392297 RepID=UPI0039B5547D
MSWWEEHVVPRLTDAALSESRVGELRAEACAGLTGTVLEIGFGSGLNLRHLPSAVTEIRAVEPNDLGWSRSERRRTRAQIPITRTGLDGQRLSEPDDSVDHVLSTFTLCTIPDPAQALTEVRRVLRPGGTFAFLEHGLAPEPGVQRWQHRLDPVQRVVFGGCNLSRNVPQLLTDAGFTVEHLRTEYVPGTIGPSKPWTFGYVGAAR